MEMAAGLSRCRQDRCRQELGSAYFAHVVIYFVNAGRWLASRLYHHFANRLEELVLVKNHQGRPDLVDYNNKSRNI